MLYTVVLAASVWGQQGSPVPPSPPRPLGHGPSLSSERDCSVGTPGGSKGRALSRKPATAAFPFRSVCV